MGAYYNEIDPLKAEVLREAIKAGAIAPGDVDERSIADVAPDDLVGYAQCHFFAGGGFWSLALRYAGWPDDREVWTGSCPCPSFSAAGKGGGFDDPRHLWPYWDKLIDKRRPPTIFGEQADDAVGYGWLDLVQTDLEAKTYSVGKVVFGACSVGAPHIRQRLYFVADAKEAERWRAGNSGDGRRRTQKVRGSGVDGCLGDTYSESSERNHGRLSRTQEAFSGAGIKDGRSGDGYRHASELGLVADADGGNSGTEGVQRGWQQRQFQKDGGTSAVGGFWADAEWIPCRNPKVPGGIEWRPIEPGTFPLAHGSTARVGRLRMFGDGIVVTQAQAFIEAYLETGRVTP